MSVELWGLPRVVQLTVTVTDPTAPEHSVVLTVTITGLVRAHGGG